VNIPGGWELVLVLVVVLVVFGSKRLPDSARALGRSLRILKAETKGLRSDDEADGTLASPAIPPTQEQARFDPYTGEPLKPPTGNTSNDTAK
jgi:sec-independent protein translocase protein TatA